MNDGHILTYAEAAEHFRVPVRTLRALVARHKPRVLQAGRRKLFDAVALSDLTEAMRCRSESKPGRAANLWIVGTVAGQRIRESARTDNPRLAEERRVAREAELYRTAIYGERVSVSFADAVLSYLNTAPRTEGTKRRLHRLIRQFGPDLMCNQVDQARLDAAAAALLRSGSKPATRLREIVTPVSAVLQHAARRKWCAPPVFERARAGPARTEWLTPTEASALVDAAAAHLRPLLVFLLSTGARLGEALRLDWHEVDLTHARAVLRETKNGRDRIVELPPRAAGALLALSHRNGVVFRRDDGEPYADRQGLGGGHIKTAWAGALKRSGIGKRARPIPAATPGLRGTTPNTETCCCLNGMGAGNRLPWWRGMRILFRREWPSILPGGWPAQI